MSGLTPEGGSGGDEDGNGSSGPSSVVTPAPPVPSTPKRLLGSLLSEVSGSGKAAEADKLEEELMTLRIAEVEAQAELKDQRLKVMELETQVLLSTYIILTSIF